MVNKIQTYSNKNKEIIERYFSIADYIGAINGRKCEVIVHDISDLDHSIVHIVNSLTGRGVGDGITDFALEIISKREDEGKDFIINYIGTAKNNEIVLRSSTYYIRDEQKNIIGFLCVNIDITDLLHAKDIINDCLVLEENYDSEIIKMSKENFDVKTFDLVENLIKEVVLDNSSILINAKADQKKEIVRIMDDKGIFGFKGAVSMVSNALNVSSQTMYRYLKEIKGGE